jgi:LPPG:FO 2-phospho-L-lactate transferase
MTRIAALCGGVGGAKLAAGLVHATTSLDLIINTGDDFSHYGLPVCPDLDTVLYTLAGAANAEQGWGRAAETLHVQNELAVLGEQLWFVLGDKDIALHLLRARLISEGARLSQAMAEIARRFGVSANLLPMTDAPAPTMVDSDAGLLPFQEYFVARRCAPKVHRLHYGDTNAPAAPEALAALTSAQTEGIIICPSNPYLSVAPILAVDELRNALLNRRAPALAVCPLIGGRAVKGPTAKIMADLGLQPSAVEIARFYTGLIDILVLDSADADEVPDVQALGMRAIVAPILMQTAEDRIKLARHCVEMLQAAA